MINHFYLSLSYRIWIMPQLTTVLQIVSIFKMKKFFQLFFVVFQISFCPVSISGQSPPNIITAFWPQCEASGNCTDSFPYCPDCSVVDCLQKVYPHDCPKNTVYEENVFWGCCPACVKYLGEGEYPYYLVTTGRIFRASGLPKMSWRAF